jgi:opacity protein-like surface antigen
MKKCVLVLVLAGVLAGGAFAQEWYNSYSPGIDQGFMFLNFGIGLGPTGSYDMGVPPLSVSADFKLPVPVPITIGGIFTYSRWKYDYSWSSASYDFGWNNFGFGVRSAYHFGFVKNLDVYAGLTLGFVIQTFDGNGYSGSGYKASNKFLFGINTGARYFFTNNVGVFLELGYSRLQFVSTGLSLKF